MEIAIFATVYAQHTLSHVECANSYTRTVLPAAVVARVRELHAKGLELNGVHEFANRVPHAQPRAHTRLSVLLNNRGSTDASAVEDERAVLVVTFMSVSTWYPCLPRDERSPAGRRRVGASARKWDPQLSVPHAHRIVRQLLERQTN